MGIEYITAAITNERLSAVEISVGHPQDAPATQRITFIHEETVTDRREISWDADIRAYQVLRHCSHLI